MLRPCRKYNTDSKSPSWPPCGELSAKHQTRVKIVVYVMVSSCQNDLRIHVFICQFMNCMLVALFHSESGSALRQVQGRHDFSRHSSGFLQDERILFYVLKVHVMSSNKVVF